MINEITANELKKMRDEGIAFQLIDVREREEFEVCNLGGELFPLGDLAHHVDKISRSKKVILHCRSGARSAKAVAWLQTHHGFNNLYSLTGGILYWIDTIDPSMTKY